MERRSSAIAELVLGQNSSANRNMVLNAVRSMTPREVEVGKVAYHFHVDQAIKAKFYGTNSDNAQERYCRMFKSKVSVSLFLLYGSDLFDPALEYQGHEEERNRCADIVYLMVYVADQRERHKHQEGRKVCNTIIEWILQYVVDAGDSLLEEYTLRPFPPGGVVDFNYCLNYGSNPCSNYLLNESPINESCESVSQRLGAAEGHVWHSNCTDNTHCIDIDRITHQALKWNGSFCVLCDTRVIRKRISGGAVIVTLVGLKRCPGLTFNWKEHYKRIASSWRSEAGSSTGTRVVEALFDIFRL